MAQTVYDPPVSTYIPLQTITLGSAASSVTFASIPQTYRDLVLVVTVPTGHNSGSGVVINSDTDYSSNYSRVAMAGNGSSGSSFVNSGGGNPTANHDLGALRPNGQLIAQFMDYSATDKHKTILTRAGGAANDVWAVALRWADNSAVTTLVFSTDGGNLPAAMVLSLYGIAS
jgi:hypothetical protein